MSAPSSSCVATADSGREPVRASRRRCCWNVTPSSSTFGSSENTWNPPESVSVRPSQPANLPSPPKPGDRLGAGPQHQVVRVAEHDLGAERVVVGGAQVLDRAAGADRHEQRRRVRAVGRGGRPRSGGTVGGDGLELDGMHVRRGYPCARMPVEQHRVAEAEEAVVAGQRRVVQPAPAVADEGVDHHQQRRARQVEVRHQQVDHLPVEAAVDEQVGAPGELARARPPIRAPARSSCRPRRPARRRRQRCQRRRRAPGSARCACGAAQGRPR